MKSAAASRNPASDLHHLVVARLAAVSDLPARLADANLPAVREAAELFNDCLAKVSQAVGGDGAEEAGSASPRALFGAVDGLMALREGRTAEAAAHLLAAWRAGIGAGPSASGASGACGMVSEPAAPYLEAAEPSAAAVPAATDPEWLVTYFLACEQVVTAAMTTGRARLALRSLTVHLGLSQDDLGRVFGVAGETVRRWERGLTGIPPAREAEILAAESALRRLLDLFRPARLAPAIRRPADLFAGESAYDWILRGRIAEVADRYESALSYQG